MTPHNRSLRPRRIGIDARFYRAATGGIGRYTRELLHHLLPLDRENQYFIFLTPADMAEWDIDQPNVTPVVVHAEHYTYAEQTSFLKELYTYRLDLVHFLNFNLPALYAKPFVTTLHDLTLLAFPARGGRKSMVKQAGYRLILKRALQGAKKVIAIAEHTASDAEKRLGISHAKMEVIYEGGPEPLRFLPGSKDAVQKYIGSRDPYFLFVSQWRPHKGIITLIEAFDRFKHETGLPHKLVLVGRQDAADEQVKIALTSAKFGSDIVCPGFAPDDLLPALYHYATALTFPSEYEGFGLPILEALVHETPVIAANNSSIPEVLGDAGLLFPTRDVEALARHMVHVATDPALRESLIARGPKQLAMFSWKRCAEQTLAVYRAILEKRR